MDHEGARHSQAAEKYVAKELPPKERDAFEEHFFDCPECASAVRLELTFAANTRFLLHQRAAAAPKRNLSAPWFQWLSPRRALAFSLTGNAVLAVGFSIGLITGSHPSLKPQLIPAYFAPGPARGSGDMRLYPIPSGTPAFLARIPVPAPGNLSYSYEILTAEGKPESSGALRPATKQDPDLYLEVPVKGLHEGVHTLQVRGHPGNAMVSQFRFRSSR